MLDVLKREGLSELEFVAVTDPDTTWGGHAPDFEKITFPVAPDPQGTVWSSYGTSPYDPYDVWLVDKKGRLVVREKPFSESLVSKLNAKIRQLYAE
jgi:hypothetical protein